MKRFVLPALVALTVMHVAPVRADIFHAFHERQVMGHKLSGKLEKAQYYSAALGEKRALYVYTPPAFALNPTQRYPVLVLLHGAPGEPLDWLYEGNAHRAIDQAIASGALPPCLVVLPDGHGPFYKGGSEWADAKGGTCNMETAVVRDLTQYMEKTYRASTNPALWAIGGLSEGGYGAANLAVRHPDRFQSALVFSGDLRVKDDWGDDTDVFGTDPAVRSANSPIEQIRRVPAELRKKLHFYVAVGADDDQELVSDAVGFTSVARSEGATVRLDRDPGAHKWGFWSAHFQSALPLLGQWWKQVIA
ncbi:alpha/beta hydrolase [Armatimonas rosea]|uniref:S-formylglutathione hydrolase FrmB n=1 Tax=Armatimonas rosea TaxID=685828 RepID=A0A7W9SUE4_ARMRO|nr:alpha/beta hydrolase-fold protein [Armatimonas rosea]MBB6052866.1 S-formylglutathione hydrolase FrmB [Armatimonas rosea]